MPKITSVNWTAAPPPGVNFNTDDGTFSGTPTTAGTYTIPVTVTTNWGSDTENVTFIVAASSVTHTFTVQAKNALETAQKEFSITVN